jgi:sulfide:quinone oxidoreductase
VELVRGEITELDAEGKRVRVGSQELRGDALIVALGADVAPETIPGLGEAGHNLYTLPGSAAAGEALRKHREGKVMVLTATPAYKCPAAPYEVAMLVRHALVRRGAAESAPVEVIAAEAGPMGTAGPDVSAAVRALVESHGIAYQPGRQVSSVSSHERLLRFTDGSTASFDLLLYVPPNRAPRVLLDAGLASPGGWVPVDPGTLASKLPGVFVVGDATGILLASGKPLPKAGVFARAQAEVVAANLAAEWRGQEGRAVFDGRGACFIETGGGRAGYGAGDFYATPAPVMALRRPSRLWHWGKVLWERQWLSGRI